MVQQLEDSGLPVKQVETYTAGNDPNKLLGRPGQYTSKANFSDARAKSDGRKGVEPTEGGSVEVFADENDAKTRFRYVKKLAEKGGGFFSEYDYLDGLIVLRVSSDLTPNEAAEYEEALGEL